LLLQRESKARATRRSTPDTILIEATQLNNGEALATFLRVGSAMFGPRDPRSH
jgi:hypothetical protein